MSRTVNSLTWVKNQMRPNEKNPCSTVTRNSPSATRLMSSTRPPGSTSAWPVATFTSLPAIQGNDMVLMLLSTSSTMPTVNLAR